MKNHLLLFSFFGCLTCTYAQDRACTFKMFDGHPEIVFSGYTKEVVQGKPYVKEQPWDKAKFDELEVYSVFCEEMMAEARKEVYKAYETVAELASVVSIGHSDGYEIWDVVLKSEAKTYYIHFQFELSEE